MSKDIDDQAGFIAATGFWESPLGKKWAKEDREAWAKIDPKENMKIVFLDMKNCKLKRFEDE